MRVVLISVARKFRNSLRSLFESDRALTRLFLKDLRFLGRVKGSAPSTSLERVQSHLLITSTGNQNIGDQAMFEAFVRGVGGVVTAIVGPRATYVVPEDLASKVTLVSMPRLVYGRGARRRADLIRFARMVGESSGLTVVGADLMDGGYQGRVSTILWALAAYGARVGRDTRVLGFSWREGVPEHLTYMASFAAREGVKLMVRDPDSLDRLRGSRVPNLEAVADVVFSDTTASEERADAVLREANVDPSRPFILLNTSALIARTVDLIPDYLQVVRTAQDAGLQVLLLPHVGGVDGGDFAISATTARIANTDGGPKVGHVTELMSPTVVRALTRRADFIVTGRMHLAVIGLSQGTPAAVLATQGKVEGLMRSVGLPDFAVDPRPGCGEQLSSLLGRYLCERYRVRELIGAHVSALEERSRLNFTGIQ